jgi:hypothetical protein
MWWYRLLIPALGRLKQEDDNFETRLGYTVTLKLAWDYNK